MQSPRLLNACAYGYRLKARNIYLRCKLNIKSYSFTLIPEAISNTNEWGGNGQTGIKHICDWNSNGWAPSLESKTKSFKTDYRKMSKTLGKIMAGKKMLGPEMSTQKNHGKPPSFKQKGKPFKTAETKTKQQTQSIFLYIIRTWHLQTLIFKDFLTTSTRFEGDYISLESVGFGPLPLLLSSLNTAQFRLFTFNCLVHLMSHVAYKVGMFLGLEGESVPCAFIRLHYSLFTLAWGSTRLRSGC